jgi:ComF family protein
MPAEGELRRTSGPGRLLSGLIRACGLDEKRCGACLEPFVPHPDAPRNSSIRLLCPECLSRLQPQAPLCRLCGQNLDSGGICGPCLTQPPPWGRLHAIGTHRTLLRDLLLRGKYGGDRYMYALVGSLLAEAISRNGTDAEMLLPVPLHTARLRERGFNQCHELAGILSGLLGLPRVSDLVRRLSDTPPQTGLSRLERLRNLPKDLFAVTAGFAASGRNRHMLIVDDTITTGSTLRRLTHCLLREGAAGVEIAVVAVTPRMAED